MTKALEALALSAVSVKGFLHSQVSKPIIMIIKPEKIKKKNKKIRWSVKTP